MTKKAVSGKSVLIIAKWLTKKAVSGKGYGFSFYAIIREWHVKMCVSTLHGSVVFGKFDCKCLKHRKIKDFCAVGLN